MKIAVAGTGYVGLSLAVLLSQHNEVHALDIVPEKVEKINAFQSPIQDDEIERFLAEAQERKRELDLHATVDVAEAYTGADYAIVATPTNYDSDRNFFDTSSVEAAIAAIRSVNPTAWIVVKSTIPVGYTASLCEKLGDSRIIFSPEFLRESKALYDNLHPSRIVVGAPKDNADAVKAAETFAELLAQGADPAELERVNVDGTIGIPRLVLGTTEAEAVKLFANTYLALRVAYFNELDTYCEMRGLNTHDVIACVLSLASGLTTTIPALATAGTVCRRTPSSCWPTTRMCRKISSRRSWRRIAPVRITWLTRCSRGWPIWSTPVRRHLSSACIA